MIPAVLWTAFIVYGLTSEPSGIPTFRWLAFEGADKLIHVVLFTVESLLIALSLQGFKVSKTLPLTLLWCFFLGGGLELIQYSYIDGRSGEVLDLVADMLGAALGALVLFVIKIK